MKDLYAQLGIERTANAEEIAASAAQRPDLQECASILLDAGKRSVYDRAHANLKLIGELRRRLHLNTGDSWFSKNYTDFAARNSAPPAPAAAPAPQPAPATPRAAPVKTWQEPAPTSEPRVSAVKVPETRSEAKPAPGASGGRRVILIAAVLVLLAAAAAFWLLL